ncbi:hypothetical protein [Olivibacter sitiensis]|uniref:hypothetical protein n=1 Tax=Olivibacter sitiensis TaxID=376470 RepID=UPI0004847FFB|nr:hypothetical protein [Olivibacter sitiensis]
MMLKNFAIRLSLGLLFSAMLLPQSKGQENRIVHLGLLYPLSTNGTQALQLSNTFSFHAIGGLSAGEKALALYGVAGIIKGPAQGLQASGALNYTSGTQHGVQMAGIANLVHTSGQGAQLAGATNSNRGDMRGIQMAGIANLAKNLDGFQIAGAVNKASDVRGMQMAGIANKAKNVRGLQLAPVNIAESSDYPIGLVNIVKSGEKRIGLSLDESLTSLVSFRSGGRVLYGILGIGGNFSNDTDLRYGIEGGIGAHIVQAENFRFEVEASQLTLTKFSRKTFHKSSLRLLPSVKLNNSLWLFAGPTASYSQTNDLESRDLVKWDVWDKLSNDQFQAIHFGAIAGVHVIL